LRQTEFFIGVNQINQAVGYRRHLIGGRFGSADIHIPVHLPAVGSNYLTNHNLRQTHSQPALTGTGRPDNSNQLFHSISLFQMPLDNTVEIGSFKACASDQSTVYLRLPDELGDIAFE
jgi:hypothetical protein